MVIFVGFNVLVVGIYKLVVSRVRMTPNIVVTTTTHAQFEIGALYTPMKQQPPKKLPSTADSRSGAIYMLRETNNSIS